MRYTILIADDEELERDALSRLVASEAPGEPDIIVAANGKEVVAIAEAQPVDIALLDIRMPGLSGLEAAESLREGNTDLALVFISAFDFFAYAQHALRLRAEDYLIKPVEDEAVLAVIGRWYDEAALRELSRPGRDRRGRDRPGTEVVRPSEDGVPGSSSAVTAARFNEAIRFLERELLDDVIAGESDPSTIGQGLSLLEIGDHTGYGIVVKPRLDHYPLPLDTDDQKRAVNVRLISLVGRRLGTPGVRVLYRAHPDAGYLIVLGSTARPPEETVHEWLAPSGIEVSVAVSAVFEAIEEIGGALRGARRRLSSTSRPDEAARRDESRIREELLHALSSGDPTGIRAIGGEAWSRLSAVSDRDRLTALLIFLDGAIRLRAGISDGLGSTSPVALSDPVRSREDFLARLVGLTELVTRPEDGDPLARRMRRWVEENFHRNIGLPDIARAFALSESHCSREFARLVGVPFNRYLRERRLAEGRRLLVETRLPVVTIATQIGFRDANYFSRIFRRATGAAPAEWRRRVRM